jgi:hypothetical protein
MDVNTRRLRVISALPGKLKTQTYCVKVSGFMARHVWIYKQYRPGMSQERCQSDSIIGFAFGQAPGPTAVTPLWSVESCGQLNESSISMTTSLQEELAEDNAIKGNASMGLQCQI